MIPKKDCTTKLHKFQKPYKGILTQYKSVKTTKKKGVKNIEYVKEKEDFSGLIKFYNSKLFFMRIINVIQKEVKLILILLCVFFTISAKSQDTCTCNGEIINDSDFKNYTDNYRTNFFKEKKGKNHTEWIFLPRNYFLFLNDFLKKTYNSDGVWVYFITLYKQIDFNQQLSKDQLLINIVASEKGKPKFENLKAFYNISSIIKSNNKIHLSTHSALDVSLFGPKNIFDFTQDQVLENSYRYKIAYSDSDGTLQKKYSERLHICKAHIAQIADFLDNNPTWEGVKMYFGSYNKLIGCTGNEDPQQFTLLLLPVENRNKKGSFNLYNNFLVEKFKTKNIITDIYNHGSLCPQICN